MLRVVLDTNIILSSIFRKSPYHFILDKVFKGKYELYVTTEILLEYEEKISQNFNQELAEVIIGALLLRPNVKRIQTYFELNLITTDFDDNKFVDCSFASNAHYLVSNDKHFQILKHINFPKIGIINISDFGKILLDS